MDNTDFLNDTYPAYEQVADVLGYSAGSTMPSQVHGMLAGFICAGKKMDGVAWMESFANNATADALSSCHQGRNVLLKLYEISEQKIIDMAFDFRLLLPDDEEDLSMRAKALGYWCQGFIGGLRFAGVDSKDLCSQESKDAFIRFTEIAKIDYESVEVTEEDEKAYVSVLEYVRLAVLMIHSESVIAHNVARQEEVVH